MRRTAAGEIARWTPRLCEVGARLLEARLRRLEEDLHQGVLGEVVEQHHGVEARQELRRHAVVEEILVAQPVAQREDHLLAHLATLDAGDGLERAAVAPDGDAVVNRVVEALEGAGADEEQPATNRP